MDSTSRAATHTLDLPPGETERTFTLDETQAGEARIVVDGLQLGGNVRIDVDGEPVDPKLLTEGGRRDAAADRAVVTTELQSGPSSVSVREEPGVQFVNEAGTATWFVTTSESDGNALFSYDLSNWDEASVAREDYCARLFYGPQYERFLLFTGCFDQSGKVQRPFSAHEDVRGTCGDSEATLSFVADHPPWNVRMPMAFTVDRDPTGRTIDLRVRQKLQATGPVDFDEWPHSRNLQFMQLVANANYGEEWPDETPDFFWAREQVDDAADTLPGSHTHFCRMDDNSRREFTYPPSTEDPSELSMSGPAHHVGASFLFRATNTVGGWFSKDGVGSAFLVFHRYESNFRDDLCPQHSHCGDGADTHFYVFWNDLFGSVEMEEGDELDIEYSLFCLPTELRRTDVEALNEVDLFLFGTEDEQNSRIVEWLGTEDAFGLRRSDGSIVLRGVTPESSMMDVPEESLREAQRIYRIFDPGDPTVEELQPEDGTVKTENRWYTVVDCGSAIRSEL